MKKERGGGNSLLIFCLMMLAFMAFSPIKGLVSFGASETKRRREGEG